MTSYTLTREGFQELGEELKCLEENLERVDEQMIVISLSESITENREFQELREERLFLLSQIEEITNILENATVVSNSEPTSHVEPGRKIRLENHKICHELQLVDDPEANPLKGKVSAASPLGSSLIGKRLGEEISVESPLGITKFVIVSIN
ncbi:MAG: GreA/GreB family elongation factor [Candidatus Dojkabacteria bacterium]|nr:GreA/GreB family elongation factor [Candidatus Dojkabacteria bacterium]